MCSCNMRQFPINWKIQDPEISVEGQYISELELNNEWKILCNWRRNQFGGIEMHKIQMCRLITSVSKSIFGTLTLLRNDQTISTNVFAKLIEPGISSIKIMVHPRTIYDFDPQVLDTVSGTIYITSIREQYSDDPENGECDKCIQTKSLAQFLNDFERLLDPQSACFADLHLKCGDALIPSHKSILSTRSPVFAAMFANEMKEKHENQVNITDMDESVVRDMMVYIYTGKTPSLTESLATDLLFAADKYQLEDLKRVCCYFLKENVSLQNVLRLLVLGDLHAEDLKSFAVDYICNKCTDFSVVEKTEEWKALKKQRGDLAIDVLASLVKSRDRKSRVLYAETTRPPAQCLDDLMGSHPYIYRGGVSMYPGFFS